MMMVKHLFLFLFLIATQATSYAQDLKVNSDRLQKSLSTLATYGKNQNGGSDRIAYSTHDIAARPFIKQLLVDAGLEVSVDHAGNIIGRKAGKNPTLKPISMGSHIDEVPNGGDYDGPVGVLGAIEVIRTLQEAGIQTEHPLEVIVFTNEEGGVIGSRALVGGLSAQALQGQSNAGMTHAEGIRLLGGDPSKIASLARSKGDIAAFLELHIEQGGNLDTEKLDIGVVEGIVAIEWWEFTFKGKANHAGTTPMDARKDPMLPAARFTLAVNEVITRDEGRQVGTVGKIQAFPGAGNVIPGEVKLNLEIRDLSSEKIWKLYTELEAIAKKLALESGTTLEIKHIEVASKPALANPMIREIIESQSKKLGYTTKSLPSGAGHDAQEMARIAPMGMIFIPSRDGISHAPEEYSSPEAIAKGANALLHTLLELDRRLSSKK
jgi:N-carbamoyl-L-amino-acid hydrolase